MRLFRGRLLLALCVAAFGLFVSQSIACFVERAGVVACAHECTPDDGAPTGDESSEPCCGFACHAPFVVTPQSLAIAESPLIESLAVSDDRFSDGPVREIDLPPQLS